MVAHSCGQTDRLKTSAGDLTDVYGHQQAKRALEIVAAGGHHLLMVGAPGSGKTMLARRLPGILPPLRREEAVDVTRIWSAAGLRDFDAGLTKVRPFRAPHHTASRSAAGRRRSGSATGGSEPGASWGVVLGRTAGVLTRRLGGPQTAHGGGASGHLSPLRYRGVSRGLYGSWGDEPLPLRILRASIGERASVRQAPSNAIERGSADQCWTESMLWSRYLR